MELERARMEFDAAARSSDKAKALDAAKRAVAFGKGKVASDRLRCAWALELAGEVEKAEAEYASVAKDFPGKGDAAEAMYRRAMSLLRREQWAAAELSLAEALASGIDGERRALALYWRGVASVRSGHASEGVALLKDAVKAGLPLDESREARLMIADADFNAGRTEEAKAAYTELIRQGALERMGAAKTLSVGKLLCGEEAKLCAQSLVKSDSAEWRQAGYALLGSVEEEAGAYGAAVYAYSKAMEEKCSTESLAKVALRLGVLESRGGDPVKAEAALKRAVELNAKDQSARAEAYLALAEAALQRHDVEKARGYATVVTTLFENSPFAKRAEEILKSNLEEAQ
jgi:tetratricopeptide (TPR) repeat protein